MPSIESPALLDWLAAIVADIGVQRPARCRPTGAMLDIGGVDNVADICVFGAEGRVAASLQRFTDIGATEFSAFLVGDAVALGRTIEVLTAFATG
jgi:hypothetical protein